MPEANLKDLRAVLDHLLADGRKIAKSKLYADQRKGLLRRHPDGTFRVREVERYAASLPLVSAPDRETEEAQHYAARKARAEAEKLEEQAKAERFRNEVRAGKYIPRDDVEVELAARAGVLATGLRTMFETSLLDFIHVAGGDPRKAPELLSAFERQLDAALNEYSRPMDYEVTFHDDDAADDARD